MKILYLTGFALLVGVIPLKAADTYGPLAPQEVSRMPEGQQAENTPSVASEGSPALAEIQGSVDHIDQQARVINVKDRMNKFWTIRVDPNTRIVDNRNRSLTLSSLQKDDHVNVYLNTRDSSARQIDLIPNLAAEALGFE